MSGQHTAHQAIEAAVASLHYELVDVERTAGGLLRVTIDRLPSQLYADGMGGAINVDDCELVTRQLKYLLEVENVVYHRLEVSSPGLDRPLRQIADYERFCGQEITVTLKVPFQGRKNYRGLLAAREGGWRLEMPPAPAPARKPGKAKPNNNQPKADVSPAPELALDFTLDEVREARLVPVVNFKGRVSQNNSGLPEAGQGVDGGHAR